MQKRCFFRGFLLVFCKKITYFFGIIFGKMEIYLEDAIIENMLVDGALLALAVSASGQRLCFWRILLAAAVGAAFALVFPFLSLPALLGLLCKLLVGAALCLIAVKKQKGRGRYALTILLFYAFAFCFGGGLTALFGGVGVEYFSAEFGGVVTKIPVGVLTAAVAVFFLLAKWGIRKLYARKRQRAHIVSCKVARGQTELSAVGFVDTGNTAVCDGKAVCFACPDLLFRLFDVEPPKKRMTIRTVSGEKTVGLYPVDRVEVVDKGRRKIWQGAYLSPAVHICGKEYELLLPDDEK